MSFLKKHAEIIYSYLIGIVSLFTGLIILINLPLIHKLKNKDKIDLKIHNIWDFLNAFFSEIIRVMSRFIGNFPVVSAVIIILFGILVILIGYTLFRTTKYDYDISIFFLVIGILYFLITITLMTQVYGFWAIIFVIPFVIHTGYIVYKDELYQENRKVHYLWIIISYGISYLITQMSLYGKIDANEIEPIDIFKCKYILHHYVVISSSGNLEFLFLRRAYFNKRRIRGRRA